MSKPKHSKDKWLAQDQFKDQLSIELACDPDILIPEPVHLTQRSSCLQGGLLAEPHGSPPEGRDHVLLIFISLVWHPGLSINLCWMINLDLGLSQGDTGILTAFIGV